MALCWKANCFLLFLVSNFMIKMLFFLEKILNPEELLFNLSSYLLFPPSPLKTVIAVLKQMHVGGFHGARQQLSRREGTSAWTNWAWCVPVFWCKHRCPNIAGISAADQAYQKRETFSLIIYWQMQWRRMGHSARDWLIWIMVYLTQALTVSVFLLPGSGRTGLLCSVWWPRRSGCCHLCLHSPAR